MKKQEIIAVIILLLIVANTSSTEAFAQGTTKDIVEYTSDDLRDPLISPWEAEVEGAQVAPVEEEVILLPSLSVQGMVWGVEPVKAIINEQVVGKGDTILDVQVLDIKKDGVYLLYKGKEFVIRP